MKKKLICGLLAAALLMGSAPAAFTDISGHELAQTAAVLKSLKIMDGVGGSSFAPSRSLTRAEFSKLLVTALGVTDVTAYKNYTIFPDVPNTHWGAGYINAAIKHADIKKKEVIHGYADGTFRPDAIINYGEACTMLLLMMGYTVEDIGPMWPGDYIARAQSLELTNGASVMTAASPVTRADAAIMLLNTLSTAGKDDVKLLNSLLGSSTEDVILLATSQTDSDLSTNQALFYIGGEAVKRTTVGVLDAALIGAQGTIYQSRTQTGSVQTLVPDRSGRIEEYTVKSTANNEIETREGTTIKPDRDTQVFVRGEVLKFSESWFDMLPGDNISLSYDADGKLRLISVGLSSSANTFVYGTKSASALPSGYRVVKNGAKVDASALKQYDVVSLDSSSKTATVSDKKITGIYDSGTPSFKNPEKITLLGNEFSISENAAAYFSDFKAGDRITLLLDSHGMVAAAVPYTTVRADMTGILDQSDERGVFVTLFNGVTLTKMNDKKLDKSLIGRVVSISQDSNGVPEFTGRSLSGKAAGVWQVDEYLLGSKTVSPTARIWEMVADKAPAYETSVSKLPESIAAGKIRYTISDSAGTVIAIVLGDVTGDAWNYGFGYYSSKTNDNNADNFDPESTVTLRTILDDQEQVLEYKVIGRPEGVIGAPIGIPKGAENNPEKQTLSTKRLTRLETVELTAFDASDGVRTSSGYYELAEECGVYISSQKKFVTLRQAKSDYTNFTLFVDDTPEAGGKIRVIMVN